ncbi:hypothetical protein LTR36_007635 [Oleoguttula mirabilis]|uniref:alpha-1,2-Mannosidase n=1 Tax=Oleoguttula mirabilis TaxID=1507867 RepID=A0AAV9JU63_9PEZI|nr:hypothetical protein LTR36_007635 [Oleoguttula mirabilis]
MPSRRRVRLLAAVLVFVVVAVLYTRRAPIETYADFVTEKVVGGGAVLRGGGDGGGGGETAEAEVQRPAALPTTTQPATKSHGLNPITQITATRPASQTTLSPHFEMVDSTPSTSSLPATSSVAEQVLYPDDGQLPAITDDDELPVEFGQGRLEIETEATSAASAIHWTKHPEHFPISTTIQLPTESSKAMPRIQYAGKDAGKVDAERLAIVKEATQHAWDGYRDAAFGADEVRPISGGRHNPFNGWGATLVDSLDTLWIMGMQEEFDEAVEAVREIDFTTSPRADIPLFETTIRYLGGLVAAYDISGKQTKYSILLDKAVELAEILYSAFDTPNRMPVTFYRWKPAFASQPHRAGNRVVLAELGSLSLEFTRLAQLTGEPKYYDAIARITDAFDEWQNNTRLPGMWPISVDASGCMKPVQAAHGSDFVTHGPQQPVPGSDGQLMQASEPVKQGAPVIADKPMQRPGMGKIVGHGAPITEGALDGKSGAQGVSELGSAKRKRQLDHVGLTEDQRDELVSKTQLNSTAHQQGPHTPLSSDAMDKRTGQDVCFPHGLGSSSRLSTETFTLGGQSDSVYEYLPKQYMLLGGAVEQYRSMYEASADVAIDNLVFRPMTIDERDILIAGQLKVSVNSTDGSFIKIFQPESEHLTCFAGGMFAMGGKLFNRPADVEIGRKLTEGCVWAYSSTTTGIMPELFTAIKCKDLDECKWNQTEYWHRLDPYEKTRTRVAKVASLQAPKTSTGLADAVKAAETSAAALLDTDGVGAAGRHLKDTVQTLAAKVLDKRQLASSAAAAAAADPATIPSPPLPSEAPPPAPTTDAPTPSQSSQPLYTPKPPLSHQEYVQKKLEDERLPPGFVKIGSRKYILRPEAIESVFYLYRITGEQRWRDAGWAMFTAIDEHTRALYGNSAIDDVTKMAPEVKDSMESFWLAETLKYFYLLFDDAETWSLDDWVLNTEAHFFRRPDSRVAH